MTEPLEPFATQAEQQAAEEALRKAAGIDGEREQVRDDAWSAAHRGIADYMRSGNSPWWPADAEDLAAVAVERVMAEVVDPLLAKIRRVEELAAHLKKDQDLVYRLVGSEIYEALEGKS